MVGTAHARGPVSSPRLLVPVSSRFCFHFLSTSTMLFSPFLAVSSQVHTFLGVHHSFILVLGGASFFMAFRLFFYRTFRLHCLPNSILSVGLLCTLHGGNFNLFFPRNLYHPFVQPFHTTSSPSDGFVTLFLRPLSVCLPFWPCALIHPRLPPGRCAAGTHSLGARHVRGVHRVCWHRRSPSTHRGTAPAKL